MCWWLTLERTLRPASSGPHSAWRFSISLSIWVRRFADDPGRPRAAGSVEAQDGDRSGSTAARRSAAAAAAAAILARRTLVQDPRLRTARLRHRARLQVGGEHDLLPRLQEREQAHEKIRSAFRVEDPLALGLFVEVGLHGRHRPAQILPVERGIRDLAEDHRVSGRTARGAQGRERMKGAHVLALSALTPISPKNSRPIRMYEIKPL